MFRRLLPVVIFSAVVLGIVSMNLISADGPAQAAKSSPGAKAKPKKAKQETRKIPRAVELSQAKAPSQADLRKALETLVPVDFEKVPLNELVQRLAKATGTNMWLDAGALLDEGVALDTPITLKEKPIAAARVLDRILEPWDLTWIIQDHIIQITTLVVAEEILVTVTYPVGDLLEYAKTHPAEERVSVVGSMYGVNMTGKPLWNLFPSPAANRLFLFLYLTTDGSWQMTDGTGGTIMFLNNNMLVRQTHRNQLQTAKILSTVRQFTQGQLKLSPVAIRPPQYAVEEDACGETSTHQSHQPEMRGSAAACIRCGHWQSARHSSVHLTKTPSTVKVYPRINPLNWDLKNLPADSLLRVVLKPLGLTGIVEDGRLVVTTSVAADERLFTKIHDIRDLSEAGYSVFDLIKSLEMETFGPWLMMDGTGGAMFEPLDGLLGVRQTEKVHNEVAAILADLRKQIADSPNKPAKQDAPDPQAVSTKFYLLNNATDKLTIRQAILALIEPKSWSNNGGEGEIVLIDNQLVVKTRNEIQTQVEKFLQDLGYTGGGFNGMGSGMF